MYPNSTLLSAFESEYGVVLTETQLKQVHELVKQERSRHIGLSK
jgi:hypothetical protein